MGFSNLFKTPSAPTTVKTEPPVVTVSQDENVAAGQQQKDSTRRGLLSTILSRSGNKRSSLNTAGSNNTPGGNNTLG